MDSLLKMGSVVHRSVIIYAGILYVSKKLKRYHDWDSDCADTRAKDRCSQQSVQKKVMRMVPYWPTSFSG